MRTRENAGYAAIGGALVLALMFLGLLLMNSLGGFTGSLTFSAFAVLWVLFGVTIAVDCFRGALRGR